MAKTIFISSFNPFILRNILVGDALKVLKETGDTKVVILVPDYKADFFEQVIGTANVIIEGVKTNQPSKTDIIFRYLTSSLADTPTIFVNKRVQLDRDGRYVRFFVSWVLMKLFSRTLFFKRCVRWLDYLFVDKSRYSKYFSQYQPQLIFATDVFNDMDVYLLAAAKRQKVKTVGMIRSWDNFTTKGFFRMKPDYLLVHNEILKKEAVRYSAMAADRVEKVGLPQYDRYFGGSRISREGFFKKLGFDRGRKTILFSPFGRRFTDTDWQIMEVMKEFIEAGQIPPAQVLVRLTPNDKVSLGGFAPNRHFYIDQPGHAFVEGNFSDRELTAEDMEWLADCLHHSDVVVAGGASIGIDAAVFGKPTVLIHFDGFEKKPYWQSVERFLEYQHPREIIKSGAMRSVRNTAELRQELKNYLGNPGLDRPAREKMLRDQCWRRDGCSGQRIGQVLLSLLKSSNIG